MSNIQIKDVTKVFGDYNDQVKSLLKENKSKDEILKETGSTVAVKNANFTIEDGEVFVVMGLSGSGKSTLIRLINRLIDPTDGDILINSNNISSLNKEDLRNFRRDNLSMVFQSFALFPFKTVVENVAFGLEVKDVPKKERLTKAEESLKLVGLDGYKDQYPNQLSGGMRQRVALIRTLAIRPKILLLDEAFSALDYQTRLMVTYDIYKILKNEKITTLMVTHDISEAISMADKVIVLSSRPATIKSIYNIDFEMENPDPLSCRKSPKFSSYFDTLWKELDVHG